MENSQFLKEIENNFRVYQGNTNIELETWTKGGVNMFINLEKESNESYLEQFRNRVMNFDIDEETDVHRQDQKYRTAFTIRQSLEDFEDFERLLKAVLYELDQIDFQNEEDF